MLAPYMQQPSGQIPRGAPEAPHVSPPLAPMYGVPLLAPELDAEPLLIDLSLADASGERILETASTERLGLLDDVTDVFEQALRMLRDGDPRKHPGAARLPVSHLTLRELLAWAALNATVHRLVRMQSCQEDQWQALRERLLEFERQLTERARARAYQQVWELTARFTEDEDRREILESTLVAICARLERDAVEPCGAVVEILRAVVAATGAGEPAAPDNPAGTTLPVPTLDEARERLADLTTSVEAMSPCEWEDYLTRAAAAEDAGQ